MPLGDLTGFIVTKLSSPLLTFLQKYLMPFTVIAVGPLVLFISPISPEFRSYLWLIVLGWLGIVAFVLVSAAYVGFVDYDGESFVVKKTFAIRRISKNLLESYRYAPGFRCRALELRFEDGTIVIIVPGLGDFNRVQSFIESLRFREF